MAWIIASWRPNTGEGTVRSPHFGPISFGRSENVDQVDDFQPGETVVVEVEGPGDRLSVRREQHLAVPPGTKAYCIVTQHGDGQDGPRIFIVAGRATVLAPQQSV